MKKQKYFKDLDANPNFPQVEDRILNWWKTNNSFVQSVESRPTHINSKNNEYIFYDGPPFANGLPHYGHLLTGFVKDLFARYQTIKGKRVERRFGWDCHGLPAELGAEKELGISGRQQIIEYGVGKFNEYCQSSVLRYTSYWEQYVTRQARWVDFDNSYKTMDRNFMESVLWAFKELYKKGYVYESYRVMPYSWACETPLSNFETRLDNSYREISDKSVTLGFKLKSAPSFINHQAVEYRILAWTTTPWTLPSNLALAVNPELEYRAVAMNGKCYIIADFALAKYKKEFEHATILEGSFAGSKLVGLEYEALFPYFKDQANSFKILGADFVLATDGTGVVHMAPGFGEDDQIICEKNDIAIVCPVDNAGKFTSEVSDYQGLQVFEANEPIIKKLKEIGAWLKTEQYLHNYPHCWRTDTPLIYKAVPSWYVEVTKFKDRMVELNQQINWIPNHIKDGIFGKWLQNARDWSISRNRFFGTPIPVWKSDDPEYPRIDVYGSIAEIEADFGVKIEDLHKHHLDQLVRPNPSDPTGKSMMRRIEDVFDCWFESGSMPYAQAHYPFENKEWFENHFPADFIVEYVAQTRGWFYTLIVLSTALFDRPPFLNCICHGVILDSEGRKLSKRLNNYADPMEIFAKYGADSMRYLMVSSPIMRGQELLIDKDGNMVRDVIRLSIKPLWNAYNFYILYANADGLKGKISYESKNLMDQYIISKLHQFVASVTKALDDYDTMSATAAYQEFMEILNNWYIRRNRARFWSSEYNEDKQQAYDTLHTVIDHVARVFSPILPLTTEEIFLNLKSGIVEPRSEDSVHLQIIPDYNVIPFNESLANSMDRTREVCAAALAIRNIENLRVRLPLASLTIYGKNYQILEEFVDIIRDEVNVKHIEFEENYQDIAELKLSLNFKELGQKMPDKIKSLLAAVKEKNWQIRTQGQVEIAGIVLDSQDYRILLEPKEQKGKQALSSNDAIVELDLSVTDDLMLEGYARDIVRFIQNARKEANLNVSDRITLHIEGDEIVTKASLIHKNFIESQTLSSITNHSLLENQNYEFRGSGSLEGGLSIRIGITKIY